jgi:hypothetical protein
MTAPSVREPKLPKDSAKGTALTIGLSSIALGAGAFLGDAVHGIPGSLLLALTSSGFSWGIVSLLMAFRQDRRSSAMAASTTFLLGATVIYYLLILVFSQRWRGGYLDDGSSTYAAGLLSIGRAAGFWMIASSLAGPAIGILGWRLKTGGNRESAILAGITFGLLSAQGLHIIFFFRAWTLLDTFGTGLLLSALLTVTISALTTLYIVTSRKLASQIGIVLTSAGLSALLGLSLWRLVEIARTLVSI